MRALAILFPFLFPLSVFCQITEIFGKRDTLIIRASNITVDPFMFGDNALALLKKADAKISTKTYLNRHVDNKVDTVFTFTIGSDKFNVYQWSKDETILISVSLTTNKFKTRHGIQIGMTKSDVMNKLQQFEIKSIPNYLVLESVEYPEQMILSFKKEILIKIDFEGYID